jgi:predicted dehydrogenase
MIKASTRLRFKSALPRKLKWGISGCGSFAEIYFLPSLLLTQRSKLISIYSKDFSRAKNIAAKFGAHYSYNDFDKFLESDFNVLYVSSVNSDHHWQVIKAAKAGKNILCESPMAISSSQAEEMVKVCSENNVILMINNSYRYHPLVQKAKELLDKKILGKILSISVSIHKHILPGDNFRLNNELSGGGVLRDLGYQAVDILRFYGGEITGVQAYMDNVVHKSDVEDFVTAVVKLEKEFYGSFTISYNTKKPNNKIEITGYNGSLTIENYFGKRYSSAKLIIDLQGEAKKVFRKRTNKILFMLKSVQKIFLKNKPLLDEPESGIENMKVIEKIESQYSKRKVKI